MRKDHDIVLTLLRQRKIDVKMAKLILSSPLIVIPDSGVTTDDDAQLVLTQPDNPWGKFLIHEQSVRPLPLDIEHPLIEYSVLSVFKISSKYGNSEVVQHLFIKDHGDGAKSVRSTIFYLGANKELKSKVFMETNNVPPVNDNSKELEAYLAVREILHYWLDYTRSIRLTPVLQKVKGQDVSKKSSDGAKVKSAPHASLIFLDRLPNRSESVEDVERVCTESTSKRGHQRIAYRKTLTADRYRNHPKYMVKDGVRVRTTWVGERTSTDLEGNTYTVMELK